MNDQQETQQNSGDRVVHERCVCHEVLNHLSETFGRFARGEAASGELPDRIPEGDPWSD